MIINGFRNHLVLSPPFRCHFLAAACNILSCQACAQDNIPVHEKRLCEIGFNSINLRSPSVEL